MTQNTQIEAKGLTQQDFFGLMVNAGYNASFTHPHCYENFSWATLHRALREAPVPSEEPVAKAVERFPRAEDAIKVLRAPDQSMALVPDAIRRSLAELIEQLCAALVKKAEPAVASPAVAPGEDTYPDPSDLAAVNKALREQVSELCAALSPAVAPVASVKGLLELIDHHVTDDDDRMSLKAAIRSTLPGRLPDHATIEVCARLVEANMLCEAPGGVEVLHPRTNPGNKVGQAYADAIRALSTDGERK